MKIQPRQAVIPPGVQLRVERQEEGPDFSAVNRPYSRALGIRA